MRRDWKKSLAALLVASLTLGMTSMAFAGTTSVEEAPVYTESVSLASGSNITSQTEMTDDIALSDNYVMKNYTQWVRPISRKIVSGDKVIYERIPVSMNRTIYKPNYINLQTRTFDDITNGNKKLALIVEYIDFNPEYDGRERAWNEIYEKNDKGQLYREKTSDAKFSTSVSIDAAIGWATVSSDGTGNIVDFEEIKGGTGKKNFRVKAVTFKGTENATVSADGTVLKHYESKPKKLNTFTIELVNANKGSNGLTNKQKNALTKHLKAKKDENDKKQFKFPFGIMQRELAGSIEDGHYALYSKMEIRKGGTAKITGLYKIIRYKGNEGEDKAETDNSQSFVSLKVQIPIYKNGKGAIQEYPEDVAKKKFCAYIKNIDTKKGTVTLQGIKNFSGSVVLRSDSKTGLFSEDIE